VQSSFHSDKMELGKADARSGAGMAFDQFDRFLIGCLHCSFSLFMIGVAGRFSRPENHFNCIGSAERPATETRNGFRPPEFVVCPLMRKIRAFRYFWPALWRPEIKHATSYHFVHVSYNFLKFLIISDGNSVIIALQHAKITI
jgi:hypothetical protein